MVRGYAVRKLAAAVITLGLMAGCGSQAIAPRTNPVRLAAFLPRVSSLHSSWPGGKCKLSGDTVHFSSGKRTSSLHLDSKTQSPSEILCSDEHTVVVDSHFVVVGLGGGDVLEGREMLGSVDGAFVPANSFSVNIDSVREEGLRTASIVGGTLELRTEKGRNWKISLSSPSDGWNIY